VLYVVCFLGVRVVWGLGKGYLAACEQEKTKH
jgi:hypothetical protein